MALIYIWGFFWLTLIVSSAISKPWRGDLDQWLSAALLVTLPIGVVNWRRKWRRKGWEGIKAEWRTALSPSESGQYRKLSWWGVLLTVVIIVVFCAIVFIGSKRVSWE